MIQYIAQGIIWSGHLDLSLERRNRKSILICWLDALNVLNAHRINHRISLKAVDEIKISVLIFLEAIIIILFSSHYRNVLSSTTHVTE